MIYHVCSIFFFLKHFRISIGLNFCWSPVLEALLEMKKKNTKDNIKCLKYYVIMTVVGSQIVAHTQMETGDGPNKPNTINL